MPNRRLTMRKVRDILRLKYENRLTNRQIARSLSAARSTVADHLTRARMAGIEWPLPDGLDDEALERLLFPPPQPNSVERPPPDLPLIHNELRRKGVTLQLLWQEYKAQDPNGYQYTRFCDLYRGWSGKLDLPMRFDHKAGEKAFVDYAGHTVPIVNRLTGESHEAQIFVAVLGASSYTFAEATWTQSLPDWIGSHVRAFEYFGGTPEVAVPDNLKSSVTRACRYEPDINPTYQEMASHYGVAVIPARVRKPKDKAKVEAGVQLVERWILARLRNRTFFSLAELNEAIGHLLEDLNNRPFKKLPGSSRRSMFEELDKPALKPLPANRYEYAEWVTAKVNIDYHVEVAGHYYSVPYRLVRERVEARLTSSTVEIFRKGKRVASHIKSRQKGKHTTVKEHMPRSHQAYLEWTPSRIVGWAEKTGPATAALAAAIMEGRAHPQQGFRSCLGVMRLGKEYGPQRLEAACVRALAVNAISYRSVRSILQTCLDKQPLPGKQEPQTGIDDHPNIRGSDYYN